MGADGHVLGMGQMLVEGGNLAGNLRRAVETIETAAARGCRIVVLPECLDVGWTHPSARTDAAPIPGPSSDVLAKAAKASGTLVAAGLTERDGDRIFNSAVLIDANGDVLLKHRKINVLGIARDLYSIGVRLSVADTPVGVVGMNICADNFPDSQCFAHSLARMGAQLIVSPSAWAVDADHDNAEQPYGGMWQGSYSTIAKQYGISVFGVSNVGWMTGGPWDGRKCIGCSLAVGPEGNVIAQGEYGEAAHGLVVVPFGGTTSGS